MDDLAPRLIIDKIDDYLAELNARKLRIVNHCEQQVEILTDVFNSNDLSSMPTTYIFQVNQSGVIELPHKPTTLRIKCANGKSDTQTIWETDQILVLAHQPGLVNPYRFCRCSADIPFSAYLPGFKAEIRKANEFELKTLATAPLKSPDDQQVQIPPVLESIMKNEGFSLFQVKDRPKS